MEQEVQTKRITEIDELTKSMLWNLGYSTDECEIILKGYCKEMGYDEKKYEELRHK